MIRFTADYGCLEAFFISNQTRLLSRQLDETVLARVTAERRRIEGGAVRGAGIS
jgi:hypothetical protein